MTPGRQFDPRWTLTPENSEILVDPDGFSLICSRETIIRVCWDKIRQIVAYTRFRESRYELCLAFAFSNRRNDQVVVHHLVRGWDGLCLALAAAFPAADPDWHAKASPGDDATDAAVASVVPVFTINPTIVWSRTTMR